MRRRRRSGDRCLRPDYRRCWGRGLRSSIPWRTQACEKYDQSSRQHNFQAGAGGEHNQSVIRFSAGAQRVVPVVKQFSHVTAQHGSHDDHYRPTQRPAPHGARILALRRGSVKRGPWPKKPCPGLQDHPNPHRKSACQESLHGVTGITAVLESAFYFRGISGEKAVETRSHSFCLFDYRSHGMDHVPDPHPPDGGLAGRMR